MSAIFDRFARNKIEGVAYYPNPKENPQSAKLVALLEGCRSRALAKIKALCPHADTYNLEVGWILDNSFNAAAGKQEDIDCIAINLGVVHSLRNLFLAMLSYPRILTNIGNAKLEHHAKPFNPKSTVIDLYDFNLKQYL